MWGGEYLPTPSSSLQNVARFLLCFGDADDILSAPLGIFSVPCEFRVRDGKLEVLERARKQNMAHEEAHDGPDVGGR